MRVIGVDEHRWSHTRRAAGDGYVTVIVDLTPVLAGTGRARLLDLVPGRSAAALTVLVAAQTPRSATRSRWSPWTGSAATRPPPPSACPTRPAVMDPFHVVALAGTKLDLCRQRVQQDTCGHRGRTGDPLYRARRTLRTRYPLLTSHQKARLEAVFADDNHLAVAGHLDCLPAPDRRLRHPDRRRAKTMMTALIDSLRRGVPAGLKELAQLGRTL